jgi:hypothetical protein
MKALNLFFIALFVVSAALQYNDPDPYVWMPVYLYGAFLCCQALRRIYQPVLYIAGLVVYISYALYLLFDGTGVLNWLFEHHAETIMQPMKTAKPWIEETREFFGLLLLILALCINMIAYNRREPKRSAGRSQPLVNSIN